MATCQVKKGIVFILSESPYASDRNYHLARMALAIALDAAPRLILSDDAVRLAVCSEEPPLPLNDVPGQLRLLCEMEVPVYVIQEDLERRGISSEEITEGFKTLPRHRIEAVMNEAKFTLLT